jgi:hypothetical protein
MADGVLDALRAAGYPMTVAELAVVLDGGGLDQDVLAEVASLEKRGLVTRDQAEIQRTVVELVSP